MEQIYTVASLTYVSEKDTYEKVACSAIVYLTTKETFDHTYEKLEYNLNGANLESSLVEVTEEKTVEHFQQFDVDFSESTLDPLMFTQWDDLTEEQVIGWVKSIKGDNLTVLEETGTAIVLEKKDRILNPKQYEYNTPPTPWRVRADQEAAEQL